jgi:demethylmenaquinone methyltransferase / 2-methoxy-6-polyprenyl-1,4-benzoquinol methylase
MNEDVFGTPRDTVDAMTLDLTAQALWQRHAQIRPVEGEGGDAPAFHMQRQAAADGFDFGKLGHLATIGGAQPAKSGAVAPGESTRYVPPMIGDGRASASEKTTDFGYRRVAEGEKAGLVRGVFDSVARRYDLMNDLMSGGIHRLWKLEFIDRLNPRRGETVLDVAGGTGDIALGIVARTGGPARGSGKIPDSAPGTVIVCDLTPAMLAIGRDRAIDRGVLHGIEWLCGDAELLPIASASVDAYTIAFGLRNVTRIDAALAEARRVLKPGGRFFCLEFSQIAQPALARLYDFYSFRILPQVGALVAQDRDAYQYLVESIRRFPAQQALVERIEAAGLERPRYRNLSGGIAAIHSAWRL